MSLATLIYARLTATSAVTAIVSTRITPETRGAVPTFPALIYGVESSTTQQAYAEASHFQAEVETVSIAKTKAEAEHLSAAVLGALERFVGEDSGVRILSCVHSRSIDGYLSPVAGENLGVFTSSDIFSVIYENK